MDSSRRRSTTSMSVVKPRAPFKHKKHTVEEIVRRRLQTLTHLRRAYEGKGLYLNLMNMHPESFETESSIHTNLVEQWFLLALSVGRLVDIPNGAKLSRAVYQLLEELDHKYQNTNSSSNNAIKFALSKPIGSGSFPMKFNINKSTPKSKQQNVSSKPFQIGKKRVFYEYLDAANLPLNFSQVQVVLSLCDMLTLTYTKFKDGTCNSQENWNSVVKIDDRIRDIFIKPVVESLRISSVEILKNEFHQLKYKFRLGKNVPLGRSSALPDELASTGPETVDSNFREIFNH